MRTTRSRDAGMIADQRALAEGEMDPARDEVAMAGLSWTNAGIGEANAQHR